MSKDFIERPRKNEKDGAITYVQELLKQAREDRRNEDVDKLENLIRLLNTKKYGLVWEEHAELVEEEMKTKIPVFIEDETKKIVGNPESEDYNFLLEGDNLHSLHLLKKTHAGKIDVIYIDPPYNTGSKDFKYNDKFVDKNDSFSHSKWLSFMERRLRIARDLLSPEGVIFVSIGDDENATLKLLMDDIFGESNYLNQISVKTKQAAGASGGGEDKKLKKNIEYLLVYTKFTDTAPVMNTVYKKTEISKLIELYKQNGISWKYTSVIVDRGDKIYYDSTVDGDGNEIKIYKRENVVFKSVGRLAKDEGVTEKEIYEKYFNDIFVTAMPQSSIRPRVLEKIGQKNLSKESVFSIEYVPKTGRNKGKLYEQFYKGEKLRLFAWFSDVAEKIDGEVFKKDIEGTLWDGINLNNLSKEGGVSFDNGKKPLDLLDRIFKMYPSSSLTILDFFAGSGSTGHAVTQLNKEDGGSRKFILCTNNENNICENVTYKRLENIQGELPHNLKYFKTDFVVKEEFPDVTLEYELLNYVKPLVELEFGVDISNPKVQVILTEEQLDEMAESDFIENSALFIHPEIFFDEKQERILRDKNITKQEIPHYYFGKDIWS
ncbi:site-specific DNA-methyltransferase [Streptococcus suis]|uniref:site-specific DNA-methyltransferase n=1 Tax=Streptococcus suis TaxID=1307 RepID=UPI000CF47C2D|nr:site-specific DNA-methyltransferase [Streptococcus suis]MDW8649498.1 site-specific DNA-methyltransferase [Streptococcus suis]HEL1647755.1 site-specific DNA-methyltransferase [Streptococcus suis]HEM3472403.1 site-specific DNA-methyltransferase [Streptococcus suis]HEM3476621.1 site-specific DNA-methyltransferase [Streptococcus suis]HEM3483929.1 site-specific DNA-methyltransferase [Streptococcus suis]